MIQCNLYLEVFSEVNKYTVLVKRREILTALPPIGTTILEGDLEEVLEKTSFKVEEISLSLGKKHFNIYLGKISLARDISKKNLIWELTRVCWEVVGNTDRKDI